MIAGRPLLLLTLPLALAAAPACRDAEPEAAPAPLASAAPPKPVDRLAPDELAPGSVTAFGLQVPRGMRLTNKFHDLAYIEGTATQDALVEYVKERVDVQRVELAENSVIFPRVHIKGQPVERLYDIEVRRQRGRSRIVIRDVTPEPSPQGLTEDQRWERAGLSPTGELLNKDALR